MPDPFDQFDEIADLRFALAVETDRGCALQAASYLDSQLELLLSSYFIEDHKTIAELFNGTGGLSTFSARIAMAFALGLIPENVRNDLTLIRKIRNEFSHSPKQIDFNHAPIADRCRQLHFRYVSLDSPPRRFFENAVFGVASHVHAKKWSAKRPAPPHEIVVDEDRRKALFEFAKLIVDEIRNAEES